MADTQVGMSYEVLVEEGRRAREAADGYQWVEGDLALQVEALTPENQPRDPETGDYLKGDSALKRYATDIDIPYSTIATYRNTAKAWPENTRVFTGYRTHQVLASLEDRFEVIHEGMTTREAERIVKGRKAASHHPPGWMEMVGEAGDALKKAQKQLDKLDAAIGRQPNQKFRDKAARYADWADDVAARLRRFADWTED